MLGGKGRTKRAVGSMRGKKIPGLGALRQRKAARATASRKQATRNLQQAATGAVASRGGRPAPRRRSPFRRRASVQQRMALGAARGRPRVQAARRR